MRKRLLFLQKASWQVTDLAHKPALRLPNFGGLGFAIGTAFSLVVGFWILMMILLPTSYMVDYSFRFDLPPGKIGGPEDVHTLENYRFLMFGPRGSTEGFVFFGHEIKANVLHLKVFFRTIVAAIFVTALNLAICYPVTFFMAQRATGGLARLMILCLILPFWVNEILRAFAFRILLGSGGVVNTMLMEMGLIAEPFDFIRADIALYSGLTYAYILLMVFPLYNALESLDRNQIEAARDLGAPVWRIHWRVVIPHAKAGIASGCTMVFMLTVGALAMPQILGGPSNLWFTQVIYDRFNTSLNWPLGAAYAFVLLVTCIVFVLLVMRLFRVNLGEIAK